MSPPARRSLAVVLLILGTAATVVLAWELATAGRWRSFWILLTVILVSSGVTIVVSELRGAQLSALRAEVAATLHAQRAEVRVVFDEIQDHRDETQEVLQAVLRLGVHTAHTLPIGRAVVVSQTVVRTANDADTEPVEAPKVEPDSKVVRIAGRIAGKITER